jgi:DNA-binding CsgD family transcriptional regulator
MRERLTEKQRDERDLKILRLLAEGLTQAQVAARMGLSREAINKLARSAKE